MSDGTNAGRSAGPRRHLLRIDDIRLVIIVALVIALVCALVGGHLYGQYLNSRDLAGRDTAITQLVAQNQALKRQLDTKVAQATEVEAKLKQVQATLDTIMPTANTYNIEPNQSLVVADGHLTVGLVGSPANENVMLNINGKLQTLAAGQVIGVAPDSSTNCQVQVQSFDMFKALLVASCTGAKPQ